MEDEDNKLILSIIEINIFLFFALHSSAKYIHFCLILSDSSKVLKEIIIVFIIHKIFSHKAFLFLLFMFWKEASVVQRNGAAQKNLPQKRSCKTTKEINTTRRRKFCKGVPGGKK